MIGVTIREVQVRAGDSDRHPEAHTAYHVGFFRNGREVGSLWYVDRAELENLPHALAESLERAS